MEAEAVPVQIEFAGGAATPSSWKMLLWRLRRNPKAIFSGTIVLTLLVVIVFALLLAPRDPLDGELSDSLASPSGKYLLGAVKNGRDILSRLIFGTRTALDRGARRRPALGTDRGAARHLGRLPRRLDRRGDDAGVGPAAGVPAPAA